MAKTTVRSISVFLNGEQVTTTAKNIAGAFKESSNQLAKMVVGSADYLDKLEEVKKYRGALDEHRQRLSGIEKGWGGVKSGIDKFVGVAAGAFAVDTLLSYGKQLYNTAAGMDALQKKARAVFGETLPQVEAAAQANARAMGLTNSEYVAAAANIQDLLVPMGFQRDQAADISTELVNLSGALSEWSGGQRTAAEVSEVLNKALLGERDELKSLGISISEADVQAQLAAKGMEKLTGKTLEQAKANVTLELILAKSTDAQAAFANGSDSMIRRQAELSARISEIIEKISTALVPVFESLISVAGGVASALEYITGGYNESEEASKSLAEQTKKTQFQFNAEIETLTKGNFTQEERGRLISEINSKYSEYLPNLISEKASLDDIRVAQEKANEAFSQKILYIAFEEKLTEVTKKAAQATDAAYEAEKRRQDLLRTRPAADKGGAEEQLALQVDLQRAIREEAVQTVKNAPDQAKAIEQIYGQLAEQLGTTLSKLKGKFGPAAAEETKDVLTKEEQKLQDKLKALIERTAEIRSDLMAKQTTDEIEIAVRAVEKRYEAEIKKALELEAEGVKKATEQRKILETLKAEEINLVTREIAEKARVELEEKEAEDVQKRQEEEIKEMLEFLDAKMKARTEFDLAQKDFLNEGLLTDQENEILALSEHYNTLLLAAQKYGLDTTALTESFAKQKAEIDKKYADETAAKEQEANQKRLAAYGQLFGEFANIAQAGADLIGAEGEKSAEFQKIATLAKIAFDTAAAISSLTAASSANPANAVTFGGAGILQYAAGLARILGAIGQAKKILQGAPKVQQKFMGGELPVTGATDGRQYNARYISTPSTGLLPHFPVLFNSNATGRPVLASERGREYFVSADSLRNPYVANLTRMIDTVTQSRGRAPQFADGGINATTANATPPTGVDMSVMINLAAALNALTAVLSSGVVAVLPDQTLTAMQGRMDKLNKASGGFFG